MPRLPQRRPTAATTTGRVPWKALWAASVWLFNEGRRRYDRNLSKSEQAELRKLMAESKGRASRLTSAQRRRLGELVRKAVTGE